MPAMHAGQVLLGVDEFLTPNQRGITEYPQILILGMLCFQLIKG
jgi:hypothetical protein